MVRVLILAFVLLSATPAFAQAEQESRQLPVNQTARTVGENNWQIGLLKLQYGVTDTIDVGTYHLYLGLVLPNLFTKVAVWRSRFIEVSLGVGGYLVDSDYIWLINAGDTEAWFVEAPIEMLATGRISDSIRLTSGVIAALGFGQGEVDGDATQGVVGMNQIIIPAHLEWLVSRRVILGTRLRWAPFAQLVGEGNTTIQLDDTTTATVRGAGAVDPQALKNAFSAIAYMELGWETFHVRIGGGWGSLSLPGLNIMAANRMPLVDLDLYWRF